MAKENRYTDAISQDLAEVRTACERLVYDDSNHDRAMANPMGTVFHLYHCAMVYRLRDGLTPTRAARLAWRKNILGVKQE